MVYCFDIDGTLCSNTDGDYEKAQPFEGRISIVNQLKAEGHTVKLYTARGTTTGTDWSDVTLKQLASWGLNYDQLILGKPYYDLFIDDKSVNSEVFFSGPTS